MPGISIGRLAKAADVKVPTIRFYEQIGLMPTPERTDSDQRVYGEAAVRRLRFIRHARQLGQLALVIALVQMRLLGQRVSY